MSLGKNDMQNGTFKTIDSDAGHEINRLQSERKGDDIFNAMQKRKMSETTKDSSRLIIPFWKGRSISIIKPLILLRLVMFIWFGAASFIPIFLIVLYKQRGIKLDELSVLTMISPVAQVIGTAMSGIAADKLGRAKPVLVTNILSVCTVILCVLLIPKLDKPDCTSRQTNVSCTPVAFNKLLTSESCSFPLGTTDIGGEPLKFLCAKDYGETCNGESLDCQFESTVNNFSFILYGRQDPQNRTGCFYQIRNKELQNISCCFGPSSVDCLVFCEVSPVTKCAERESFSSPLFLVYAVLFVLYATFFTNGYRCMDVTVMALIKEFGSDFGRERFVGMLGTLIVSPIAGLVVSAATPQGEEKNYSAAFYLFYAMICLLMVVIYKLPVPAHAPGELLWKKSLTLLKNFDVLVFILVVFILGTSWNLTKSFTFWFLEDLKATSVLLGLITSVSALYGLPFLLSAKWWIRKLGTNQVFVLAFVVYVVGLVGYSFLTNPWYALILEAHGAVSYYLLWVAVIVHSNEIAPEGLTSTVIAVAGAIHFSGGKTSAGLIGGMVMSEFGATVAFRLNAFICLTSAILYTAYLVIKKLYLKRKDQRGGDEKGKKEENKVVIFTLQEKT